MAGSSGTASLSDTRGDKNVVAQIAQLSWEKVKSAEKMAGAERAYARKRLKVGEEGGITKEEFRKKFGRGSFFRKALGSEFGGDKVARNRGRVDSFFDKDVSAGRDATKSKRSRYRSQFDYGVEAKDPMVGGKTKTTRTRQGGGGGSTGSSRTAVNEAIASALVGIEIQLTRLSEKFTNNISVPEGLAEIINAQSKVITEGFGGLNRALYSLLESIQRQTATMVRLDQEQKVLDQKNLDRQQALDEENLLEGQNGGAGNAAIKDLGRVGGGNRGGGILGKIFGASVLAKKIGRRGAARAGVRAAAAFGGKNAAKFMSKKTAGLAAKTGLKSGLKKIPLLGLGVGAFFAAQRALKGDILGAGLELTSGAASMIPGAGTAASLGVDGILAARDAGAIPFAKGGFVNKPVLGVVGEGKDPEAILPWNKRTFEMMQKARLDAIQKNKNKFADVQAKGLEEYYENRGGWEKFGEILMSLFGRTPGDQPPPTGGPVGDPNVTGDEEELLMRLMIAEAGGEGEIGMAAVARSVLNRAGLVQSGKIGAGQFMAESGSVKDIINAPGQYTPVSQGKLTRELTLDEKTRAKKALELARNPTEMRQSLSAEGLNSTQSRNIMASTGFRNYNAGAGIDASQQVNETNLKRHTFNTAGNAGLLTPDASIRKPPPTPTTPAIPKTNWTLGVSNAGLPVGAQVSFRYKDTDYYAERADANGKSGWAVYEGGIPNPLQGGKLFGGSLVNTNGENTELKAPLIEAIKESTNQASAISPTSRASETANRTATQSQEVAMARTKQSFDIINVGSNNNSSGAAVPKGDSANPGLSGKDLRPAFAEVPVG